MENNHHINEKFEAFFKHTFENFEPDMPQGAWEQIDQSVSQPAAGTAASVKVVATYMLKTIAVLLPLTAVIYLVSVNDVKRPDAPAPLPAAEQAPVQHQQEETPTDDRDSHRTSSAMQAKTSAPRQSNSTSRRTNRLSTTTDGQVLKPADVSQQSISQGGSLSTVRKEMAEQAGQPAAKQALPKEMLLSFSAKKEWCVAEPVEFKGAAAGFDRYRWDFDDGQYYDQQAIGTVTHRYDKAGWYNATLIGYRGNATQRYSYRIQVIQPMAYFTVKTDEAPVLRFVNQSRNALAYQWDFGDHSVRSYEVSPAHRFESDEVVQVRLISQHGHCSDTFSMEVKPLAVTKEISGPVIPNVFTPNQDGMNDEWGVVQHEGEIKILVLDRAGKKVFETTEAGKKWNGYDPSGKECPSGDYFYIITCKSNSGVETTRTGLIKLMR